MKAKKALYFQHIGLLGRSKMDEDRDFLLNLKTALDKHKLTIAWDESLTPFLGSAQLKTRAQILKQSDLVITLGGDGTILKTVRDWPKRKELFILGVNLGNLGFLTEAKEKSKAIDHIEEILKGKFESDDRMLLRATVYRDGQKIATHLALNDVVINQGSFARLIQLYAEINQRKMIELKADGLIVATPTGSTGHSLSAGGPIVHPKVDAILVTPICPSDLSVRPIVIPSNRQLTIKILTERYFQDHQIGLTIDGQIVIPLKYGDQIKIRRSSRKLRFARMGEELNYYKLLREKLHWGRA